MAALHVSPRGMSSDINTSIFPLDVFSIALCNSRTSLLYSARWLTNTVPGVMGASLARACDALHRTRVLPCWLASVVILVGIEAITHFAATMCELPHISHKIRRLWLTHRRITRSSYPLMS